MLVAVVALAAASVALLVRAAPPAPSAPPAVAPGDALPAARTPPTNAAAPTLVFGAFVLGNNPVTDGDTLRLAAGAPARSVRVQSVDTEEIWHPGEEADRAAAAADFDAYARHKRGDATRPVKFGTPAGEAARDYVKALLAGVREVRLERDDLGRDFDTYGRLLAHVFFARNGAEVLLSEALVRAGHSPYFVKYGRSLRFDARLRAAEDAARTARIGIWGEGRRHYPDYDERLVWWRARANQVDAWRAEVRAAADPATFVELGVASDSARLPSLLGRRITVFGTLGELDAKGSPKRLLLVDQPSRPFPIVIFDPRVWAGIDLEPVATSFVRVTGTLSEYRGRPQLKVDDPEAISTR